MNGTTKLIYCVDQLVLQQAGHGMIIDGHLHLQSVRVGESLLRAMDMAAIDAAILLGSSRFTITLNEQYGFSGFHENNLELLRFQALHPSRFFAWPTLDPLDPESLDRFKTYLDSGARGLKLYVGHGYKTRCCGQYLFHTCPIDDPRLMPIYDYCQQWRIPVCLHVNTTRNAPGFADEMRTVLAAFPALKVNIPHWLLATQRPQFIDEILASHPEVRTDISFGQDDFALAGFRRISARVERFRALVEKYQDRILFGSDLVCTNARHKTAEWIAERMGWYHDLVVEQRFAAGPEREEFEGLELSSAIQAKLFSANATAMMAN